LRRTRTSRAGYSVKPRRIGKHVHKAAERQFHKCPMTDLAWGPMSTEGLPFVLKPECNSLPFHLFRSQVIAI
jgi:hypothetical protein